MNYKEQLLKDIEEKLKIQIDADIIQDYYWQVLEEKDKEIEKLHSIIKEAIELLESKKHCEKLFGGVEEKTFTEKAIEILKGE